MVILEGVWFKKGEDVTFLVRSTKQKQLEDEGLAIKSVHGDFKTPVRTITYGEKAEPLTVLLLQ